jgi:hypothetical protein
MIKHIKTYAMNVIFLLMVFLISMQKCLTMNSNVSEIYDILNAKEQIDVNFVEKYISAELFTKAFPAIAEKTDVRNFYIDVLKKSKFFLDK